MDAKMADVKKWLMVEKKAEEPYLFANVSPTRVVSGSKLLFSFKAQLFGKATAKTDVADISLEEQERRRRLGKYVYKHSIVLEGSTVELFKKVLTKKEIQTKLGIDLDRPFRYFTKDQYDKILQMSNTFT